MKYVMLLIIASMLGANLYGQIIINHTCCDITQIPDTWIDSVKTKIKLHHGGTLHSSQITEGTIMEEVLCTTAIVIRFYI